MVCMDSKKVNKVLIDFHGVLTNGKVSMTADGTLFETVHTRDIAAIRELQVNGYEVYIITASDSPIIDRFAEKVKAVKFVYKDKGAVPFTDYIAVGDSSWDIPMFEKAARSFCPADAQEIVKYMPEMVILNKNGGDGVIAELNKHILP